MPAQSDRQLQRAVEQIRLRKRQQGIAAPSSRPQYPGNSAAIGASRRNNAAPTRQTPRQPASERYRSERRPPRYFDGFGAALENINARFSRLEDLLASRGDLVEHGGSDGAVAEMAAQIEQLCAVVEHLAGNIGEQGRIKRLESQIARLADAIPDGNNLDLEAINGRLDVLCEALERLQDLQTRQLEMADMAANGSLDMQAMETGFKNVYQRIDDLEQEGINLEPIEKCVRSIYERLDALEQTMARPNPDIEWLSRDMAEFTRAMKAAAGPEDTGRLVERVNGLVARMEQMENPGDGPFASLKSEIENLQARLLDMLEPRFVALEQRLDDIVSDSKAEISTETLERHIQALAEKLDETSSRLSGLQQAFDDGDEAGLAMPGSSGINAIADMVVERTSRAMEELQSRNESTIRQDVLDRLEARLSGLLRDRNEQDSSGEFANVRKSMDQVNDRLARLEEMLEQQGGDLFLDDQPVSDRAAGSDRNVDDDHASPGDPAKDRLAEIRDSILQNTSSLQDGPADPPRSANPDDYGEQPLISGHIIPELADNMPRSPVEEAPLNSPPLGQNGLGGARVPLPEALRVDPDDLVVRESAAEEMDESGRAAHSSASAGDPFPRVDRQPLESRIGSRIESGSESFTGNPVGMPRFDQEDPVPPPRPSSSFAGDSGKDLSGPDQGDPAAAKTPDLQRETDASSSTFIEAARRAMQSGNPQARDQEQSLFGRAMARFQKKTARAAMADRSGGSSAVFGDGDETEVGSRGADAADEGKFRTAAPGDGFPGDGPQLDDLTTVPESFLSRNRRPILLAAALVAVVLLSANLVLQRFSSPQSRPDDTLARVQSDGPAVTEQSPEAETDKAPPPQDAALSAENPSRATGSLMGDEVFGITGEPVSSPPPGVRMIDPAPSGQNGASLDLASLASSPADGFAEEAIIDMPPEEIGPLPLRQAARDGDPRAQFEVAAIFAEGRALEQDLAAAAIWYERSAAQGFAPAGYRLANMYENGMGVEKDLEQARLWYQLAAEAGNRMSMHNLASLLVSGQLDEPRFDEAAYWFERAASLGLKDSQFNLAMLSARGLGVPQSLENAYKWFSIAARLGDQDAARARDDIARSLDAVIVSDLRDQAEAWEPDSLDIIANFAPIGTWNDDFDPGADIENSEVIIRVQAVLNLLGFDAGKPDGLMGPKTSGAITEFERQVGMSPSGAVNPRLLAVLGSQPV